MSARQDDDRRIGEVWHSCNQLDRRIRDGGFTKSTLVSPRDAVEETVADGILYNLQRILEEAIALTDDTKVSLPTVPWNEIRGMRNRIVHDDMGVKFELVWESIETGIPMLRQMCLDYCTHRNIDIDGIAEQDMAR